MSQAVRVIDASRVYLAVLPSPLDRGRRGLEELRLGFGPCVPGGLAGVHAVFREIPGGGVVAIGVPHAEAEALAETATAAVLSGWPEEITGSVGRLAPGAVNLLVDEGEPRRVRAARRRWRREFWFGCCVLGLLVIGWLETQVGRGVRRAETLDAASRSVLLDALGPGAIGSGQPPQSLMTGALRTLRATRDAGGTVDDRGGRRADVVLGGLLSRWPSDVEARTESVSVTGGAVEVVVVVPGLGDAERLMAAIRGVDGFVVREESTRRQGDGVRVSVRMTGDEPVRGG